MEAVVFMGLRKYNSTLAGEASAKFTLLLGSVASFDCRISQLPNAMMGTSNGDFIK